MNDKEIAGRFLARSKHMVVAVTLEDGTPWGVPVRITRQEGRVFEWDSKPEAVHSQAIARNEAISLVVFSVDDDIGVYAKAVAAELPNSGNGTGQRRYRATVTEAWLNEQHVKRPIVL